MEDKPEAPPTVGYVIVLPDAPELPLLHVNALNVRVGVDEFYLTLGTVVPPEFASLEEAQAAGGKLTAQPLFRFAVSRQTMANFITLMQNQYQLQVATLERQMLEQAALHREPEQQKKEEANRE